MAQELVQRVCEHCGTTYITCGGKAMVHCYQCFVCQRYAPLHEMYGRVRDRGYCCRACEAREQIAHRLVFKVILNVPRA